MAKDSKIVFSILAIALAMLVSRIWLGHRHLKEFDSYIATRGQIGHLASGHIIARMNQGATVASFADLMLIWGEVESSPSLVDPFSANGKVQISYDPLLIWSIGPDKVNDFGQVTYDPSNGTYSKGDIIIHPHPGARRFWIESNLEGGHSKGSI